jgi:mandelate racemase
VVRMALSGLDAALWDALAVGAGLSLATFLGAKPKPITAYNSSGLGLMSPEAAADEAEKLLAGGFLSVKLRLLGAPRNGRGEMADQRSSERAFTASDGHPRGAQAASDAIELPVDYNQALSGFDISLSELEHAG